MKLIISLLITFFINYVNTVDKHNFKSCKDSGFCIRHRNQKVDATQWHVLADSIAQSDNQYSITAQLKNINTGVVLSIELFSLLDDGSVLRMRINEQNSQRARFEAKDSLLENIRLSKLRLASVDAAKAELKFGARGVNKAILNFEPFRIDVYSGDRLVISGNQRGLFKFEHYRPKPIPSDAGDTEKEDDGDGANTMWEETFKSWTDTKPYGPMSVGMDFDFVDFNHIYGIPEHADDFSLKSTKEGDPYRLYNLDVFEYELNSPMALYGSVPMMLAHSSERTVGLLWLNPSETWIDIEAAGQSGVGGLLSNLVTGEQKSRQTHWFSETGVIDVFFMLGPKPIDVMKQNAALVGTTQLPPYYSIGHHQCRWNYFSQAEVNEVDVGFDKHDIPLDAIWLDIEYTQGRSKQYFTWDKQTFSDPRTLISNLTSKGRRLITIIDPHLKKDNEYPVYNEAVQNNYLIKTKEGNDYEGWCWPGASMYADFVNPAVREWWASKFNPEFFPGFEGGIVDIWNDMNEPSVFNGPEITAPKDLKHVDGFEHRDVHNMYGFLMVKSTYEGLVTYRSNLRPFILTRSFFAGSQRYCAAWTGDNMSKWEHLRAVVPMLLSMSVVGISFAGADVPGFFFNPESEELVVRWYQAGLFQPFFRAHAHLDTRRREPWEFSEQTRLAIRSAIRTRYLYLPYIYTLMLENYVDGIPIMRPLWFHFPDDSNTFANDESFLLGQSLLVQPITEKSVSSVKVYFPGRVTDGWFDLAGNKLHTGGSTAIIPVDLSTLLFYQRAGSIVPKRERVRRSAALTLDDPVTLDIVIDHVKGFASGQLYLDDGYSFEYKNGQSTHANITLTTTNGVTRINYNVSGRYQGRSWLEKIRLYQMKKKPASIEAKANDEHYSLQFRFDSSKEILLIRKPGFKLHLPWTIEIN